MNRNVLAIGGLDPSGCAGIAADLKTIMAWDAYGLAVVTVVTAQNTQRVTGVFPVSNDAIRAQFESIVSDIEVHAVKVGLLADASVLNVVAELLREARLTNIVVDPVLRSTTGFSFGDEKLLRAYKDSLFPLADVITPNLDEASAWTGMEFHDVESMKKATVNLHQMGPKNIVITGGHLQGDASDVFYDGARTQVFAGPKIPNANARGLGCTFASVLAVHLARNQSIPVAIESAKSYIAKAMAHPYQIGKGRGPLDHNYRNRDRALDRDRNRDRNQP